MERVAQVQDRPLDCGRVAVLGVTVPVEDIKLVGDFIGVRGVRTRFMLDTVAPVAG